MQQTEERILDQDQVLPPSSHGQRKSTRILRVIPLTLSFGSHSVPALSAVINAHGALISTPEPVPSGTPIGLFNPNTGARIEARVVWTGLVTPSSSVPFHSHFQHKLGVEFARPAPEFWASDYDPETATPGNG